MCLYKSWSVKIQATSVLLKHLPWTTFKACTWPCKKEAYNHGFIHTHPSTLQSWASRDTGIILLRQAFLLAAQELLGNTNSWKILFHHGTETAQVSVITHSADCYWVKTDNKLFGSLDDTLESLNNGTNDPCIISTMTIPNKEPKIHKLKTISNQQQLTNHIPVHHHHSMSTFATTTNNSQFKHYPSNPQNPQPQTQSSSNTVPKSQDINIQMTNTINTLTHPSNNNNPLKTIPKHKTSYSQIETPTPFIQSLINRNN